MKSEKSRASGRFPGELERRLATVLMDSNDAILLHDFEGNILAWNRGAEGVYGYSKEEALGMNILKIIPEDRLAEASTLTDRLRKGERIESFETRRLTKDGRFIDVWLTATPMLDDDLLERFPQVGFIT